MSASNAKSQQPIAMPVAPHRHECKYCKCEQDRNCKQKKESAFVGWLNRLLPIQPVSKDSSEQKPSKKSFWRKYFLRFLFANKFKKADSTYFIIPAKPDEVVVSTSADEAKVTQSGQLAAVEQNEPLPPVPIVKKKGIDEPEVVGVKILPSNLQSLPKKGEQLPRKVQQAKKPSLSTMKPKVVPKVTEKKLQSSDQEKPLAPIEPIKTKQENKLASNLVQSQIEKEGTTVVPALIEPVIEAAKPLRTVRLPQKKIVPTPKEKVEKIPGVVEPNLPLASAIEVVKPKMKPKPRPVRIKPAAKVPSSIPVMTTKEEIVSTDKEKEEKIAPSVEPTLPVVAFIKAKEDVPMPAAEELRPSDPPVELVSEASKDFDPEPIKVVANETQQGPYYELKETPLKREIVTISHCRVCDGQDLCEVCSPYFDDDQNDSKPVLIVNEKVIDAEPELDGVSSQPACGIIESEDSLVPCANLKDGYSSDSESSPDSDGDDSYSKLRRPLEKKKKPIVLTLKLQFRVKLPKSTGSEQSELN